MSSLLISSDFQVSELHAQIIEQLSSEEQWDDRSLKLSTASNWIGVKTGVAGFGSQTPHKPVVSKTSEADIWFSSNDHLTDVGGQRGGYQKLSQRKVRAFFSYKKEAWNGLIQVNEDEERKGWQAGRVYMVARYRYLGVSNPGLQMIGSNECHVSCL